MLIPIVIDTFAVDAATNGPLILLKEANGARTFPIAIGPCEAGAIAMKSLNVTADRPLTVDMAKSILVGLGGTLDKVVIYDIQAQVFLARLIVSCGKKALSIDCRPSDAIALAMRCDTPLFADETVFTKLNPAVDSDDTRKLRETIAGLDTLEFGTHYLE